MKARNKKKKFICSAVNNAKQELRSPSVQFLKSKKTDFQHLEINAFFKLISTRDN